MTKPARRYGGVALEDRQAERRDRLVRAAINVSARVGRESASVALICAEAGLTARYFYESFANRDALFLAAYRRIQDELFARMAPPPGAKDPARAALAGFFSALADHPGPARVFLLDIDEHDSAMKALDRTAGDRLRALIAPEAQGAPLMQAGVTGAIVQIAKRWIESDFEATLEEVVAIALPFARAAVPFRPRTKNLKTP